MYMGARGGGEERERERDGIHISIVVKKLKIIKMTFFVTDFQEGTKSSLMYF